MTSPGSRIIYITHWRFPSEKTMTPLIMKTCEGFVREGFAVELWVPNRRNPGFEGVDPFEQYGIRERFIVRKIPVLDTMSFLGAFGFLLMVASFNLSVLFALIGRRDVILYAHDLRDAVLPSLIGHPLFVEIHDFYESSFAFLNRSVLARTRGLIVTNTLKMRRLNEWYGFPMERMIHQPNAVDYAFFTIPMSREDARRALGLPLERRLAIYTGHLFSWKGVDTLARAAAFLPGDTDVYFVGGTVEDRETLQKLVAEEKLPRITFLPHQEHAKVPLYLRAADVLVLPNTAKEDASKYETSPVKLFEYMSSGTPIVASDLPSIRDIVGEDEVTFFVPDDPESLARALEMSLENTDAVRERSRTAQTHARRLSWEARAATITHLIRAHTRPI